MSDVIIIYVYNNYIAPHLDCPEVRGPCCLILEEGVATDIKGLKMGKQLVLLVW